MSYIIAETSLIFKLPNTVLVSSSLINQPLNLIANLLLMGFIASAGFKIAHLGVMLVRTIKVKVKEEKKSILEPN